MMENGKEYYLREDVYFEPLFNSWYAWPYLIPPVTAARYVSKTHKRIMKSFVNNSKLHVLANKENVLTGSEFLDASENQVDVVKTLIDKIEHDLPVIEDLSQAIDKLEEVLRGHISGESIEYLYERIPDILRGYVELHMDLNHNVSYRLIEPLLYQSDLYQKSLQSVSFGLLDASLKRPFVFSTPRLADDAHIQIQLDFTSDDLDLLLTSRDVAVSGEKLNEIFHSYPTCGGLGHARLFTEDKPEGQRLEPGTNEISLRFVGHAGFLLQTDDVAILVDPLIANKDSENRDKIFSYADLPQKIDYICLTHNHQDHINLETLLQLRHRTDLVLVPKNNGGSLPDPSMRLILQTLGFKVRELDDMEQLGLNSGSITAIPFLGEHGDLNVRSKCAWLLKIHGKALFMGADSSNIDQRLYEHLKKLIGKVDVLALGMECVGAPYTWLYGALHTETPSRKIRESRRLNGSDFEQAKMMINAFGPSQVYIYALGQEHWYAHLMGINYEDDSRQITETQRTLEYCQEAGIPAENLVGRRELQL